MKSKGKIQRFSNQLRKIVNIELVQISFLFTLILATVYSNSLSYFPTDGDQLILWSSVMKAKSPFEYFVRDWGLGNTAYRPLHSFLLWITYRLYGTWGFPEHSINLSLHIVNVILLFQLIRKLQSKSIIAFLGAGVAAISPYTIPSVTFIADRPMLLVGFFTLFFLNLFMNRSTRISWQIVSILLVGALLSKESGLILVLLVFILGLTSIKEKQRQERRNMLFVSIIFGLAYIGLRYMIFWPNLTKYSESGYIYFTQYYSSFAELPSLTRVLAGAENVLKSFVAVFIPIFNSQGGVVLSDIGSTLHQPFVFFPTIALTGLSIKRWSNLSAHQKVAFLLIGLNACVHFSVFRYRTLYLGQFAFIWFLTSYIPKPRPHDAKQEVLSPLLPIFLGMMFLVNSFIFSRSSILTLFRTREYSKFNDTIQEYQVIDASIIEQVKSRYFPDR